MRIPEISTMVSEWALRISPIILRGTNLTSAFIKRWESNINTIYTNAITVCVCVHMVRMFMMMSMTMMSMSMRVMLMMVVFCYWLMSCSFWSFRLNLNNFYD